MQENRGESRIYEPKTNQGHVACPVWTQVTHLIKYMPIYNLDEEAKAQKILGGLKLEIQQALSSIGPRLYAEVVLQT